MKYPDGYKIHPFGQYLRPALMPMYTCKKAGSSEGGQGMRVLLAIEDADFGNAIVDFVLKHQWEPATMLKLLHAVEPSSVSDQIVAVYGHGIDKDILDDRTKSGAQMLHELQERLREHLPAAIPVEVNQVVGRPHHVIAETADQWNADLIVMGSHGRRGMSRFVLGSVSLSVLSQVQRTQCVVRLPKQGEAPTENVVIAVNDRLYGQHLAKFAAKQQATPGTVYHVLYVIQPISVPDVMPNGDEIQREIDDEQAYAKDVVATVSDELHRLVPDAKVQTYIRLGYPKTEILGLVNGIRANVLYIGSHGYKGLERMLFGSVSSSVVAGASCSAVVMHLPPAVVEEYDREQLQLSDDDLPQSMCSYEPGAV